MSAQVNAFSLLLQHCKIAKTKKQVCFKFERQPKIVSVTCATALYNLGIIAILLPNTVEFA